MPTYDYQCDACGHKFELFQSITEPAKRNCPECKKRKLRRLFGTGAAIVFRGSGFYKTDYRSESYKKQAAADAKPSSDTKAAADSSTNGKAAADGEKKSKSSSKSKSTDS